MPEQAEFTPAATVTAYRLEADTVLFNRDSGRVFVLNETAASIWDALARGVQLGEIADQIAAVAGVERSQVITDSRGLIEQWTAAGLAAGLAASDAAADPEPDLPHGMSALLDQGLADEGLAEQGQPARFADRNAPRHYRIADLGLSLTAPNKAFELLDGLLDHLLDPGDPDAEQRPEAGVGSHGHATLAIDKLDDGWELRLNGSPLSRCDADQSLAPLVHAMVLHLSYSVSRSRVSIHGAAVFAGRRCVLLPGQPGAGKSTLTAALVNAGLGYCTDDFAMLDGKPLKLRGIPLCIGLKAGSWPLLKSAIPAIGELPIRLREDGQTVRYLAPPAESIASAADRFDTQAIVFPRIDDGGPCRLTALPRSAALLRIAESGFHLLGGLDANSFEALLAWIRSLECYELSYSDLDEAVTEIRALLA